NTSFLRHTPSRIYADLPSNFNNKVSVIPAWKLSIDRDPCPFDTSLFYKNFPVPRPMPMFDTVHPKFAAILHNLSYEIPSPQTGSIRASVIENGRAIPLQPVSLSAGSPTQNLSHP